MKQVHQRTEILDTANGLYSNLVESLNILNETQKAKVDVVATGKVDEAHETVKELMGIVETIVAGTNFEGVYFSEFLSSYTSMEDEEGKLSHINLTLRTKLKDKYQYRDVQEIKADADFLKNLSGAYAEAVIQIYYLQVAGENIDKLNELLAEIFEEAGIEKTFSFTIDESDKYIYNINNDQVIFNASVAQALELSKTALYQDGNDYALRVREMAIEELVEAMQKVQNTPQVIKSGASIIEIITGVKTRRRAEILIRGTYRRRAMHLDVVKEGVGYYDAEVEIDGKEVRVFALIRKHLDESLTIELDPFDIKSLFNVEFDVIEAVKKEMAEKEADKKESKK